MTNREPSEDTASKAVEKRKASVENGELKSISGHTFVVPDPELIEALEEESAGRVEYFPTDREKFEADKDDNVHGAYAHYVIDGLLAYIDQKYPNIPIALRGIATSINGDVYSDGYGGLIHDATYVAEQGIEQDGDFNVVGHDQGNDTTDLRLKHMHTYALKVGMNSKFDSDEARDSLFPAILVYRSNMLERTDDRYGVKFKAGVDPKEALLKVFITDKAA